MDRRTGAPQAVLARGSIIGSVMFAVRLALGDVAAAAEGDVTTPAVEVVGHYETAVGTSDAASEGSVTYKLIEDRPLLRTGEILEFVPGMIVTQHSGDGKANQYFLRGYNLDHGTDFATFVNGMPVSMPTHGHGQGYSDLNFVIPELVEHIDFKKGPYYADEGDFASTGAAHLEYFTKLPSNIAQVTVGSNNYRRALIAASPEIADGNLLLAFEAASYDGPWVNPEDAERYNATLRYSKGDALSGLSLTAMAYDNKWNSTDQIAACRGSGADHSVRRARSDRRRPEHALQPFVRRSYAARCARQAANVARRVRDRLQPRLVEQLHLFPRQPD